MNIDMSLDYSGDQFFLPNIVRAIGQALILTPLTAIATLDIAPKDAANASGLFNMLRNLAALSERRRWRRSSPSASSFIPTSSASR